MTVSWEACVRPARIGCEDFSRSTWRRTFSRMAAFSSSPAGLAADRLHGRDDGLEDAPDVPGHGFALRHQVDGRLHGATLLVPEHDDQHALQHRRPVLDAAEDDVVVRRVAGDAHGEEIPDPLVEDDPRGTRESAQPTTMANGVWCSAWSARRTSSRPGWLGRPLRKRSFPARRRFHASSPFVTGVVVLADAFDADDPESPHATPATPATSTPPETPRPLPRNDRRDSAPDTDFCWSTRPPFRRGRGHRLARSVELDTPTATRSPPAQTSMPTVARPTWTRSRRPTPTTSSDAIGRRVTAARGRGSGGRGLLRLRPRTPRAGRPPCRPEGGGFG